MAPVECHRAGAAALFASAFTNGGNGANRANFVAAVKSRKQADIAGQIEEGHYSSSLCHLGNISYRLGAEKSNEAIKEAVASNAEAKDSFARMVDHLQANNVDVGKTPSVIGPALQLVSGTETFATQEKFDVGFWANTMLRREYRKPFVVPEVV